MRNRIFVLPALFLVLVAAPLRGQGEDSLTGRFIPAYLRPSNARLVDWYNWVKADSAAEIVATYLNARIKLPFDIRLQFQECRVANAFYSPSAHAVAFCYEYLDYFQQLFATLGRNDSATTALVNGKMYFTLYHEVGHALVHALKLPIFTSEESVVDGLATYLLASGEADESDARQAAEATVQFFILQAKTYDDQRLRDIQARLADEHALDRPRFTQIACWLYGENPSRYRLWIRPTILPAARAKRCAHEYEQLKSSWDAALSAFLRDAESDTAAAMQADTSAAMQADSKDEAYIAAMKSNLRNIATYEESFAADSGGKYFSGNGSEHGFTPSRNVTVRATAKTNPNRWSATASHRLTARTCAMSVQGIVTCR